MESKCQFQVRRKRQLSDKKTTQMDCGARAAMFKLSGDITSIHMLLCDKHQELIAKNYGWKVVPELSQPVQGQ